MGDTARPSNSLDIWCGESGTTNPELAERLGRSAMSVSRYRRFGQDPAGRFPDVGTIRRIFALSGGRVDANGLAGLPSLHDFAERLVAAGLPLARVAAVFADIVKQEGDGE